MPLLLSLLLMSVSIYSFANASSDNNSKTAHEQIIEHPVDNTHEVINITITAENDGWDDTNAMPHASPEATHDSPMGTAEHHIEYYHDNLINEKEKSEDTLTYESTFSESEAVTELPGKEVNYELNLHSSTHHLIDGRAHSDIGKILFKSRLMPSNEVKLSLKLKQREQDDIELIAYFDLANFIMELDGSNGVLNKNHKTLLKITSTHLQFLFEKQYEEYDFPEHSLMLVQMLGYWSVSPEGFVHEKRSIVSQ